MYAAEDHLLPKHEPNETAVPQTAPDPQSCAGEKKRKHLPHANPAFGQRSPVTLVDVNLPLYTDVDNS